MYVFEALELYIEQSSQKNISSRIYSSISRYIAPALGHPYPKGASRLSAENMIKLKDFLKTIHISKLVNIIQIFDKSTDGISYQKISPYKTVIKSFYAWCLENEYIQKDKYYSIKNRIYYKAPPYKSTYRKSNSTKRLKSKPYALMAKKMIGYRTYDLIFKDDYINEELQEDIKCYLDYRRKRKLSKIVSEGIQNRIMLFFGWLHRYKKVDLKDLKLTSIIFYYPLDISIDNFENINEFINGKAILTQKLYEMSNRNIALIKEYMDFRETASTNNTRRILLNDFIDIARYIYDKDLHKNEDFYEYDELPIIIRLHKLLKSIKKEPKKNANKTMVSWSMALQTLETLRSNCLATHYVNNVPIDLERQSSNLMDFLAVALCMIIPTDRPRTYYELEIGRTFLFGNYDGAVFTPQDKMQNPKEAQWYIYLGEDDYKTGTTYGDYWSLAIPNIVFRDGTNFYEYIDDWVKNKRNFKNLCKHNYFFRGKEDNKKFNSTGWRAEIVRIFGGHTGVSVCPMSIRRMHVTYERIMGASPEELEASALARHQTKRTAENIYDQRNQQEKLAAYSGLCLRMMQEIL